MSKIRSLKVKRGRRPSLDAEVRRQAKVIYASGMSEAIKAGMLVVCARKMDELLQGVSEINTILRAAGIVGVAVKTANLPLATASAPKAAPVENPCVHCGRPGVRRTKRNSFNPTGSWFCAVHAPLGKEQDLEDALDDHLMGPATKPTPRKPVLVQTHPVEMQRDEEQMPSAETEILSSAESDGSSSLAAAMAALGKA